MLCALFLINFFGTIYGYIWYAGQLSVTPWYFWPFVPDSPTASLFFTIVLGLWLFRKRSGLIEALAVVTLIKYGIWAVFMNTGAGLYGAELNWQNYMLIISHGAMAVQAVLYLPYYRIRPWHLVIALLWTVHNDIIDYVYNMHPWVSTVLMDDIQHIGYLTFWLGIIGAAIAYWGNVHQRARHLDLPS
nr:DUF1405 domain-containing protein [Salsuginibacillus kocurii]